MSLYWLWSPQHGSTPAGYLVYRISPLFSFLPFFRVFFLELKDWRAVSWKSNYAKVWHKKHIRER